MRCKMSKKIALVTGGNKGLGFEVCRLLSEKGYEVVLAARDLFKGEKAAKELKVKFCQLDVTDQASIEKALNWIEKTYGRLDLLINNAGILLDKNAKTDKSVLNQTIETNVIAPYILSDKVSKLMKKSGGGAIVNVSSQMGQLASMVDGYDAYRISKAALNAMTLIFANKLKQDKITVNSVCPGWCKTDMGGDNAPLSTVDGAKSIVWVAELEGKTGHFFQNYKEISW